MCHHKPIEVLCKLVIDNDLTRHMRDFIRQFVSAKLAKAPQFIADIANSGLLASASVTDDTVCQDNLLSYIANNVSISISWWPSKKPRC